MAKAHSEFSRHLRQKDILDRQERAQFREEGVELAPRWRREIGNTPVLKPRDYQGAWEFVYRIDEAIRKGGWTKQERNGIKRLRRKWKEKADGKNEFFNMCGNPYGGENVQYYGNANLPNTSEGDENGEEDKG